MSNDYYNATGSPGTGTSGSSQVIRSEFDAIEAMADKLPALSGNGSKLLAVNSGASALEAVTAATARVAIGLSSSAFGSGVATALTVNTGTAGSFVVNGGALGTPSSGTLTSCTGLPISSGVSGLGTGVATALAVNTGTSGSFVVNGGSLGTPSSGNGSNITNVNAATLGGATFAAPGSIGSDTPGSGSFTTGSFSGVVTGASFTPTTTATNGLGLAGANNPAIYASTTKVIDATTSGANVTGTLGVSGNTTIGAGTGSPFAYVNGGTTSGVGGGFGLKRNGTEIGGLYSGSWYTSGAAPVNSVALGTTTTEALILGVNYVEAMRIDTSRNVTMVGTLSVAGSPSYAPLSVLGNQHLVSTTSSSTATALTIGSYSPTGAYGSKIVVNSNYSSTLVTDLSFQTTDAGGALGERLGLSSSGASVTGTLGVSGAVSIGNTLNSVSPTSPNRTITMVVGGVTVYIAAKTTND